MQLYIILRTTRGNYCVLTKMCPFPCILQLISVLTIVQQHSTLYTVGLNINCIQTTVVRNALCLKYFYCMFVQMPIHHFV